MAGLEQYKYAEEKMRPRRRSDRKKKKSGSFLLHYLLPFVLINFLIFYLVTVQPGFDLKIDDPGDYKSAKISIQLERRLPLGNFTVKLDDVPVEMERQSKKLYTASVERNGTLEVTVSYKNGMSRTKYEHISTIDDAPPVIVGEELDQTMLTVSFEDAQSGVNFASVYAVDADGTQIAPLNLDEKEQTASFQVLTSSLEVHAADHCGNEAIYNYDNLDLLGNSGADRSGDYNTYGRENSSSRSSTTASSSEKSESRAETKASSSTKSETKAETKASSSTKSETKAETKASSSTKSETKTESTAESRPETKAQIPETEAKPGPAPAAPIPEEHTAPTIAPRSGSPEGSAHAGGSATVEALPVN